MARFFNNPAVIGKEELRFEESKAAPQLHNLSLFRVRDDAEFCKFREKQVTITLQLFLIAQNDIRVIHIPCVILESPYILYQMIDVIRKGNGCDLAIFRPDVESFRACCFHEPAAQSVQTLIPKMCIVITVHRFVLDVVKELAKINNQGVPVIIVLFSPESVQVGFATFDMKGDSFIFQTCAVIVDEVVG